MKYLLLILFTLSLNAHAYMAGVGTYVPYFNKVQTNEEGDTSKFELNPYFSIGTQMYMTGEQYFLPELGYVYFLDNPEGSRKEIVFLHYNFGYVISNEFLLRYGLTTHWYRIIGAGGSTKLNNGTGTSTFKNPDETRTSYFTTLNIGSEFFFNGKNESLRFDLNMMSFTQFENRSYNYIFTVNFFR